MSGKNISIVLATFNGSKYIKKQLDSVLQQTCKPDEIIICDDCSDDDTVSLIGPYLADNKIKLTVNENRLGVVENFKKAALQVKTGNWIVFADQDDIWIPEKLSKLINTMSLIDDGHTPSLVYSDLTVINKDDRVVFNSFWGKEKYKPERVNLARLLYGNVVTGCTMIINYPMAEEFFLMDNTNYLHDEWLALIAYSFGKVQFLNDKLVFYRHHENNVTLSENMNPPGFIETLTDVFNYLIGKKNS